MSSDAASHIDAEQTPASTEVVDPVCGMTIERADSVGEHAYRGTTYYLCNAQCLEQFRADPERFLNPEAHPAPSAPPDAEYTCPMDPEVRQVGPGPCPKCGMALEPVIAARATKTEWTCPMHPEIVRDRPGSCPICGMALERPPVPPDGKTPGLKDMSRRFRWPAWSTAPLPAFMVSELLRAKPLQTAFPH